MTIVSPLTRGVFFSAHLTSVRYNLLPFVSISPAPVRLFSSIIPCRTLVGIAFTRSRGSCTVGTHGGVDGGTGVKKEKFGEGKVATPRPRLGHSHLVIRLHTPCCSRGPPSYRA